MIIISLTFSTYHSVADQVISVPTNKRPPTPSQASRKPPGNNLPLFLLGAAVTCPNHPHFAPLYVHAQKNHSCPVYSLRRHRHHPFAKPSNQGTKNQRRAAGQTTSCFAAQQERRPNSRERKKDSAPIRASVLFLPCPADLLSTNRPSQDDPSCLVIVVPIVPGFTPS
ncbi:hypothetical protein VTJ04DRAFT_6711 [Mycothermus thermophilus]|uniref:uncharacterized protein n=1 Tax=Humicola insolens TaxID=85995 RepID=UPI003743C7BB